MARVLITDDDRQVRTLIGAMLQEAGHEVRQAADGAEAASACRGEEFDLVFCDLFMPNREGLETIRELRRWFPGLKIVAMSGGGGGCRSRAELLHVARLMGADAALSKPFGRANLLAAINQALASSGPAVGVG